MTMVYILMALTGGYDSYAERPVRVYGHKERAEADAGQLNSWLKARKCHRGQQPRNIMDDWDIRYARAKAATKEGHPLDPKLECDNYGALYTVLPIELEAAQ